LAAQKEPLTPFGQFAERDIGDRARAYLGLKFNSARGTLVAVSHTIEHEGGEQA